MSGETHFQSQQKLKDVLVEFDIVFWTKLLFNPTSKAWSLIIYKDSSVLYARRAITSSNVQSMQFRVLCHGYIGPEVEAGRQYVRKEFRDKIWVQWLYSRRDSHLLRQSVGSKYGSSLITANNDKGSTATIERIFY